MYEQGFQWTRRIICNLYVIISNVFPSFSPPLIAALRTEKTKVYLHVRVYKFLRDEVQVVPASISKQAVVERE